MWGIGITWLAGVGRYWDNPRAEVWQFIGMGSVVYLFIFSLLLWAVIKPLRPANWSYRGVVVFVSLTSLPALLYAIPVERWTSLSTAQDLNVGFLSVVAAWRVALLGTHLQRAAKLGWFGAVVGTLTPLVLIIVALAYLNLEHVIFRLMGGLRDGEATANDAAFEVVLLMAGTALVASVPLLVCYVVLVVARRKKTAEADRSTDTPT